MSNVRICNKCDTAFRLQSTLDRELRCYHCRGKRKANKYSHVKTQRENGIQRFEKLEERVEKIEGKERVLDLEFEKTIECIIERMIEERFKTINKEFEEEVNSIVKTRLALFNTRILQNEKLIDDLKENKKEKTKICVVCQTSFKTCNLNRKICGSVCRSERRRHLRARYKDGR